jgi:ATP-binding cassette, subfamily C (CFTR/MRP), member 4
MFFFYSTTTGTNIRKAITGMIFKKVLKFNQKSMAKASTGKIITIVSGELSVVEVGLVLAPYIVIAPISTIVAFVFISIDFYEGAAIGFVMYILIVILQWLMARLTVKWKYQEGMFSDKRVKVINDAVNWIRTIKTYGWEKPYMSLVKKWRWKQLGMLIRNHVINAIGSGIFLNGGFVIALVIFSYHYGLEREFDYSRSLSTIALLSYLSLTSIFFSYTAISNIATFVAVMFRVGEILKMEEVDKEALKDDESLDEGVRVRLENADLSWGFHIHKSNDSKKTEIEEAEKDVNLHNINIEARDGELVAIVGAVGCGKSTLLAGIMHELHVLGGRVRTNGRKAYVEQEPFVMSGTVKENILVGEGYDENRFKEVVEACCLDHDLEIMPQGADTEIGERGITISGGQKARLSLARAVYADADIYLLDDPLSAVDPDVAYKIFNKCINGYLKDKCKILVTHQIQHLSKVEKICFIEDNTVKHQGSYSYLRSQGLDFDSILKSYEKQEIQKTQDEKI